MLTTLGETTDAVAVQSGADALPCLTGAEALLPSWVVEELAAVDVVSSRYWVAATVPPEARRAARTATAVSWPAPRLAGLGAGACGAGWPKVPRGPIGGGVVP